MDSAANAPCNIFEELLDNNVQTAAASLSRDPEYGQWDGTTDDDEPEADEDQPRLDSPDDATDDTLEWEDWTDAGWDEGGEG